MTDKTEKTVKLTDEQFDRVNAIYEELRQGPKTLSAVVLAVNEELAEKRSRLWHSLYELAGVPARSGLRLDFLNRTVTVEPTKETQAIDMLKAWVEISSPRSAVLDDDATETLKDLRRSTANFIAHYHPEGWLQD